ncbi:hypothetical protein BJ138DRAFT_733934 [Hygrophoropsis aurantiaca]|uniref:Uncharacterized protein n=1 Tax=Hygrophoropsis aurantiaca TaxID=72124 RepID=A0ACB8AJB8_9AGAM|nr:hypothetical protein BJ138DRAFT_733934 [Hygrophoropsis aurantiaca]
MMFQDLAFDVLCEIIRHLPIKSIISLRRVSKHLHQITHDRSIWDHVYRTSSLARPQGPFVWQTAQMLESILVRSVRLLDNWPPNPNARPLRSRSIAINADHSSFKLVHDRWLLMKNGTTQILCYDLDKANISTTEIDEPAHSVLYEVPEELGDTYITNFSCGSVFGNERGSDGEDHRHPFVFLAVMLENGWQHLPYMQTIYRVKFVENDV